MKINTKNQKYRLKMEMKHVGNTDAAAVACAPAIVATTANTSAADWWYGPHSPNCTDATGGHLESANCAGGCLFELRADATEHVNLRDSPAHAGTFAAMKARFEQLVSSAALDSEPTLLAGVDESTSEAPPSSPLCGRMQDTYGGFFGPWTMP